jgi:hypothetical protein
MFVSLATYAKPENRTRALTLVRLAVNLGFAGPAGWIISWEWDIKDCFGWMVLLV